MNVSFRQLRAFLAVADQGSFTRAAEALHITQSAISGLIRELEAEIGLPLFDRTTRRVEPTAAGDELRAAAGPLLARLDDSLAGLHQLAGRERGQVAVAAPPLLAATLLPRAVAEYRRRYPGVRVSALDLGTDRIVARVRSGEADLGIGTVGAGEEGIETAPLMADSLMLYCGRGHRLAAAGRAAWADLEGARLVALTRDSGVRALVDRSLAAAGVSCPADYEVAQMTTAVAMVEAGLGVAILPTYARAFARLYRIATVPIGRPVVSREVSVMLRRGRSPSPAAAGLIEVLRELAADDPLLQPA